MKAKFFGILLLICFIAPVTTAYFVLKIQKKQVRKEVKWKMISGLDDSELVLLKIAEKDKKALKWKHSKEFELKGEMYDIVKSEERNDTTYYWCWWDYEETKLNKQLDGLLVNTLGNNPHHQKNQKNLLQFFKSLFFVEKVEQDSFIEIEKTQYSICVLSFYKTLKYSPPTPPPEFI
ncbi:MAG: hypothetical protein DWP98_13575 [Bacteroidetes bacterium]|nr:MAG: hypothetical protein DWP98_13575 [Bacteroidota bacterium]MBL1145037.1 hypothetical protein [Bacteroidota bacterium]NOG57834.1 hypothetical protein [Bacteroidota bacterium]